MATNQSQTTKSGCLVPTIVKVLGAITGLVAAIAGLVTAFSAFSPTTPTSGSNQNIAATTPTIPAAANPTWKVIINSSKIDTSYQGYTTDSGYVFLIIDASFENDATASQALSGKLFDLQDSTGQHYQESEASDPSQSFAVEAGVSIRTGTTFVIPDSLCNYELSFIAGSSIVSQWTITTC